jgi:rhodanese-related sulfurtransferase
MKINIKEIDKIIDLRSKRDFEKDKEFYQSLKIEAVNIDFFVAPKEVESFDKEKSYLVVCDTGMLSSIIVDVMKSKGFKKVQNVEGGIENLKKLINQSSQH